MAVDIVGVEFIEAGAASYVAIEVYNDVAQTLPVWLRRTPRLPASAGGWVNGQATYDVPPGVPFFIYDTQIPWGVPFTYEMTIVAPFVPLVVDTTVVLADPEAFDPPLVDAAGQKQYAALRHLAKPSMSVGLTVVDESLQTVNADVAVFYGRNQTRPSVVDGPNRGRSGALTVVTHNDAERRDLAELLDESAMFLLWLSGESDPDEANLYVTVPQHTRRRVGNYLREHTRVWELEVLEVEAPIGDVADLPTWQDMLDEYATWQEVYDLAASGVKWGDFIREVPPP